jgi:hypothetical protein
MVCYFNMGLSITNFFLVNVMRPYASTIDHFKQIISEAIHVYIFSQIRSLNEGDLTQVMAATRSWRVVLGVGAFVVVQVAGGLVSSLREIVTLLSKKLMTPDNEQQPNSLDE